MRTAKELETAMIRLLERQTKLEARLKSAEDRLHLAETGYHGYLFARKPLSKKVKFPKSLRKIGVRPGYERDA